ncbi:acetyltransferase [Vibrio cholerae]|nr:acetyltransferase [Vibrio cholerae]EJL6492982.1 acetyltransferase [Vibrio cholerae]EJL6644795.1 acetyltransferase [Vibrio cholerae]MBJ6930429.1 acetyltransferase [Vibrio cholerae]MBJ6938149.1 acetyltransferase [Vibrio cholerae]MBJ6965986.1 acetyltransferase [Vibrio cholerae]
MVTVVVFEFSVMRCQPLRRALGLREVWREIERIY